MLNLLSLADTFFNALLLNLNLVIGSLFCLSLRSNYFRRRNYCLFLFTDCCIRFFLIFRIFALPLASLTISVELKNAVNCFFQQGRVLRWRYQVIVSLDFHQKLFDLSGILFYPFFLQIDFILEFMLSHSQYFTKRLLPKLLHISVRILPFVEGNVRIDLT